MDSLEDLKDVIVDNLEDTIAEKYESKKIYNGADLIKRPITEIPRLVDPIFPKVGSIAMVGTSDIGKSTLLRQFALSVSMGDRDWET